MVRILLFQQLDLSTKYITLHFGQKAFPNLFIHWTNHTSTLTFCTYQGYKKLTSPQLSYTTANFTLYLFKFHFVRRQNIIFTFIIKLMGFLFYQRLPFKNNQGLDHYCVHGNSTLTPRNIYD